MDPSIKEYQSEGIVQEDLWADLGLPCRGAKLHDLVRDGLPFILLDRLARHLQVNQQVISAALCISPSTLARRMKAGRFNTAESDCLVALVGVFQAARRLFEGDVGAANEWMRSPVRGLGSRRPLDMLTTRVETEAVLDLIGRLERGAFA